MVQVSGKSIPEFFRGQLHAAQHSFDDVAVVAEQSSGCVRVMAMICPDLSAFEITLANCASVLLVDKKGRNQVWVKSGSDLADECDLGGPLLGIGPELLVSDCVAVVFGRYLSSTGQSFRRSVTSPALFLRLRFGLVLSLFGSAPVAIFRPKGAVIGEVFGPFLRRALSFPFSHLRSPRNTVTLRVA